MNDLIYQLALTMVPNIGHVHAKLLAQAFGSAHDIFIAKRKDLEKVEGIGSFKAGCIKSFSNFSKAESELNFIEKFKINTMFLTEPQYPQRLLNCFDPPTLLFFKGNADLNSSRTVSVVGTRNNSEYGKHFTEKFITELSGKNILVLSGLAFGIDSIAHKSCIKNNIQTVGVLAHGLDQIYPHEHTDLARQMTTNGGLLTEFRSKSKPDKHNFPSRNRIVAGLTDATVVIETGIKGGSMITADIASSYNRDTFAVPGRSIDSKSAGCNYLIKNNKAILLTDADQFLSVMGWEDKQRNKLISQTELFIECSDEEKMIFHLIRDREPVSIDEINLKSGLSNSKVAAAVLNLEIHNIILSLPGKRYRISR